MKILHLAKWEEYPLPLAFLTISYDYKAFRVNIGRRFWDIKLRYFWRVFASGVRS